MKIWEFSTDQGTPIQEVRIIGNVVNCYGLPKPSFCVLGCYSGICVCGLCRWLRLWNVGCQFQSLVLHMGRLYNPHHRSNWLGADESREKAKVAHTSICTSHLETWSRMLVTLQGPKNSWAPGTGCTLRGQVLEVGDCRARISVRWLGCCRGP